MAKSPSSSNPHFNHGLRQDASRSRRLSPPGNILGAFIAFGGIHFGYDTGTISGILAMEKYITSSQQALIVPMLSVGTLIGANFRALIGDRMGRKMELIVACVVFNIGVVLETIATAIPLFAAGRTIAGAGVGVVSVLIPRYQSEPAPEWIRGTLISTYQLALSTGLLLAAIWALVLAGGLLYLPETPRYYLNEIIANHQYELTLGSSSWLQCFSEGGSQGKCLFTSCAIMALSQLTGTKFIFYFGTQFFKNSGISNPFTISLTTNLVNVFSTIPGQVLVEKWGRRPLLLFGEMVRSREKVLIAFVCFYIVLFACSWGPVGWVVVGDIFPLRLRAKSDALSTVSNWLLNWAIAYATPYLVDKGPGNAGLGAKVFFNTTLEQADTLYDTVDSARNTAGFVPTVHYSRDIAIGRGLALAWFRWKIRWMLELWRFGMISIIEVNTETNIGMLYIDDRIIGDYY
ncbi:hexose transporter [Rhexocercosporidium sp. MPI-PUGE-AT-0058]|nr:hexose transporter [Rhexocercosporidium sp. MPI-PUGE-AT-0058]